MNCGRPNCCWNSTRPAVVSALTGNADEVEAALAAEEMEERRRDREYWTPLKQELEALRLGHRRQ